MCPISYHPPTLEKFKCVTSLNHSCAPKYSCHKIIDPKKTIYWNDYILCKYIRPCYALYYIDMLQFCILYNYANKILYSYNDD